MSIPKCFTCGKPLRKHPRYGWVCIVDSELSPTEIKELDVAK